MPETLDNAALEKLIREVGEGVEEFKSAHKQEVEELKKHGTVAPETKAKLDKLEDLFTKFDEVKSSIEKEAARQDALEETLGRIETSLSRSPGANGGDTEAERQYKEQKDVFLKLCRKGRAELTPDEFKVLTVSNDTTGGYLAPAQYVREIIKDIVEVSPFRTIARVRSTGNRSMMVPTRTGTFAASWYGESETKVEATGLAYGLEEIPTHELTALVDISQQDLEDSVFNLDAELREEFSEQFGVAEGNAFIVGNAVKKPEGFLNNADIETVNSGDASLLTADGLIDLYYTLKTVYARRASWVMNRSTIGAIRKLKDSQNQYLWQPGLAANVPNTILDRPYTEMPDMPDVGAGNKPVAFGDWRRGYTIVDRISMAVVRDELTQAASGNVRFIARRRVGGQVVLAPSIKVQVVSA